MAKKSKKPLTVTSITAMGKSPAGIQKWKIHYKDASGKKRFVLQTFKFAGYKKPGQARVTVPKRPHCSKSRGHESWVCTSAKQRKAGKKNSAKARAAKKRKSS